MFKIKAIPKVRNLLHIMTLILVLVTACGVQSTPTPEPVTSEPVIANPATSVPAATQPPTDEPPTALPPTAPPPTPTKAPEPVTITMWTWMNPEGTSPREMVFKQILDKFAVDYPYITVEVTSVAWQEIDAKWRATVETNSAPDLIWLSNTIVDRGNFLANLDETALADLTPEEWSDLGTMNTDISRIGTDANLVFPIWPSAGEILYYRKDLFEKAGIEVPLKTWDAFLEAAQKLSADTNNDGNNEVWGFGDSFGEKAAITTSFFYALADLQDSFYDMETKTPLFNNENALKAAQLVVDLVAKGITPRDAIANDYETMLQQFESGRFAMVHGGSHRYGSIAKAVGFGVENMGIMPWPTWSGDRVGPAFSGGGWGIGIWKETKNMDAAGLLLKAFMSPEASKLWMEVGGQVPNRVSLMNDPFLSRPENYFLALPAQIIKEHNFFPQPIGINSAETAGAIDEALQQMMFDGKVNPALLDAANQRIKDAQTP